MTFLSYPEEEIWETPEKSDGWAKIKEIRRDEVFKMLQRQWHYTNLTNQAINRMTLWIQWFTNWRDTRIPIIPTGTYDIMHSWGTNQMINKCVCVCVFGM